MMKKLIFFALFTLLGVLKSQVCLGQTVSFCEDIKDDGQMIHPNSTFTLPKTGGTIKMLVTLRNKVNVYKIVYKVYQVSAKGDQSLDQTIDDLVQPEWFWFYHDLYIRSPGNYMVYVYAENTPDILASGLVHFVRAKSK